jgi:hypothetical protein
MQQVDPLRRAGEILPAQSAAMQGLSREVAQGYLV